jgi:hypothetical protein
MNILLANNLVMLAQGYDDTGAASRWSIVIGALAFPCLAVIAVVWQKLKDAKENDKHIEELQRRVVELEQEQVKQGQEQEWEDMVKESEQATSAKLPVVKFLASVKTTRPLPSSVASPKVVRREGFFCGEPEQNNHLHKEGK